MPRGAKPLEYAARTEHLREHLTDGRWHDDCFYCRHRRIRSGNGTEPKKE